MFECKQHGPAVAARGGTPLNSFIYRFIHKSDMSLFIYVFSLNNSGFGLFYSLASDG